MPASGATNLFGADIKITIGDANVVTIGSSCTSILVFDLSSGLFDKGASSPSSVTVNLWDGGTISGI